MTNFYVISETTINSNTSDHGFGDMPERRLYVSCAVNAETARKAMNAAKKKARGLCFSGINADLILTENQMIDRGRSRDVELAKAMWNLI